MSGRADLTWKDLSEYIREHDIDAQIVQCRAETRTVSDAAREMRTAPDQIIKSLLFIIQDQPVMAVASGLAKVDRRVLAGHFGVGRKRVSLANPEQVLHITGYKVGTVPPFGLRVILPTFVDPAVLDYTVVYAGGGAADRLLKLPPDEIMRVADAVPLDLQNR